MTTRKRPQNSAKLIATLFTSTLLLAIGFHASVSFAIDKDAALRIQRELVNTRRYINPREIGMTAGAESARPPARDATLAEGQLPPGVATGVGLQYGLTSYDLQKTGSMNRQIATRGPDHCIYFSWASQHNNSAVGGLNVRGNTYDAITGGLSAGGIGNDIGGSNPWERSLSTTQDAFEDGRAVIAHHWDPAFSFPGKFFPYAFANFLPCLVDFRELASGGLVPESLWVDSLSSGGTYFAWPRVAATDDATCGKIVHLVIHDNGARGKYMYVRRTIGAGASSDSNWTDGYVFGQGGFLSPALTASRQSQKIGIAWSGGRGDGSEFGASLDRYNGLISGQNDNDLFYMESQDCGATWGPVRNVTQYPDATAGDYRAHARVTVIYDDRDSLNMAWNASRWNGYGGPFIYQGRIFHWNTARPTGWDTPGALRTAIAGEWTPTNCNGGAFNLNVSQPQLSVCNGNLYLTYSEFANPLRGHGDDCHIRYTTNPTGAANGDLLLTVSSNYGFNWDPGRDLTASYTPNCDTVPGGANPDCQSDTWHSATRYGINTVGDIFNMTDVSASLGGYGGDDYLFVQYVNDREPGAAILNEGAWILSALRTFKFGCVESELGVIPSFWFTGIDDPAHALPGQFVDTMLVVENNGNIVMNYNYAVEILSGPAGHVTVNGAPSGGGSIGAGLNNRDTLIVRLNATESSIAQNASARIVFTGDFQNSPQVFEIGYD